MAEEDKVMFLGFPIETDDKAFCTMMRDILFGKKTDDDFLKDFQGVYDAALKARKEIGVEPGDDATFEYFNNKLRAKSKDTTSQWHPTRPGN